MEGKTLKGYLEKWEGIIVQPDFEEKISYNAEKFYKGKFPTHKSYDAVIRMCRFWEKYCADENEFSKLVCKKLYSMVRIHAAAITSNPLDDTYYIGSLCKLKEGVVLPPITNTTATYNGECVIYHGFGGKMLNF